MMPPSELLPFIRIIIEVFVKCKILSTETILCGYTHTHTANCAYHHSDCTKLNVCSLKRTANGELDEVRSTEQKARQVYFLGK